MTTAWMHQLLQRVLLLGAPLALSGCALGASSCPDDGPELPTLESRAVEASFAGGGELDAAQCQQVCSEFQAVTCSRESPESVLCLLAPMPCEGRRPPGLRPAARRLQSGFARHLADAAWLEAASVHAFRGLRHELRAHGAPQRLLRAAGRAARDERRHARVSAALARQHGVDVAPVLVEQQAARSLEALALENAVEGCVRETWGALVALHQATRASELAVRAAMGRIARDEIRHAQLAWSIDAWLSPRLSRVQRHRVREARSRALAQLASEILVLSLPTTERRRLGLPGAVESSRMLSELDQRLRLSLTS